MISGSPTPEPEEISLEDAITNASLARVREVLTEVCLESEHARQIATERLLAPLADQQGKKRSLYETCKHCKAEYDVSANEKRDCVYHPGKLSSKRSQGVSVPRVSVC